MFHMFRSSVLMISEAIRNAVIRRSTVAISACPEGANRSLIDLIYVMVKP
jgi:hypothetical protein